jgi:hypothetical protein
MLRSFHRSRTSAAARAALGALLLALAATACDDSPTASEPPDDMRLSSLVVTDTQFGALTRHDFTYDASGRLVRMEFRISEVRDGPPVLFTRYVEHVYDGDRLIESNYFRVLGDGGFEPYLTIRYTHDGRDRITRETVQVVEDPPQEYTTSYEYDSRGRVKVMRTGGDRTDFSYTGNGSLDRAEMRSEGGSVFHTTYQHDTGRNPFYHNPALVNSLIIPFVLPPHLLSRNNMLRQENRVDADPTLISSMTQEYSYDDEGRPLHLVQRFINDIFPESIGTTLYYDFTYEPVP